MKYGPYDKFVWCIGRSERIDESSGLLGAYWVFGLNGNGFIKPPNIFRRFLIWAIFGSRYVRID